MRTVTTANSIYEINEPDKLIRRVSSTHAPTPHQGEDGKWRSYLSLGSMFDGLIVIWAVSVDGIQTTWTSPVLTDVTT